MNEKSSKNSSLMENVMENTVFELFLFCRKFTS